MKAVLFLVKAGDWIISLTTGILMILMLLYGGYALWDTAMLYQGAFLSGDLMKYKPSVSAKENRASLEELRSINPDVCGWLTIDETHIDYPVVQGEDDMEYINTDVYGEFALSGSIFLSSRNAEDFSDSYSLLYGHHMANGAMFGDVMRFTESDYFKEHQTGSLFGEDGGKMEINIFACVETDAYDSMIYHPESRNLENMEDFLAYIREKATCYREIEMTEDDRILGMSTCAEAETNGRVVLFGRLK